MTPSAVHPLPALATTSPDPLHRLTGFPQVVDALRQRGVPLSSSPGDSPDVLENRLGTGLMALYRDVGTEESFEALYVYSRPSVLLWIRSLLGKGLSHLDPVEILQDTFVNVYRYPRGFRDDHAGSFRVWVRTIAGNLVRRAGARRPRLSFQELPEGLQEPADAREDPRRVAETGDEQRSLRSAWLLFLAHYAQAWNELSERDRKTLQLVEVEGLSYLEAGAILGVGRSNMKMIVFRSRKRIARRMRAAMSRSAWPVSRLGVA